MTLGEQQDGTGGGTGGGPVRWAGPIAVEGRLTGDGRVIVSGALHWDTLPVPFRVVQSDVGGHDGAQVCGRIDALTRLDDGVIWAEGVFDLESEAGREAARLVGERMQDGVSVDLDDVTFEVHVPADLLAEDGLEYDPDGPGGPSVVIGGEEMVKVGEMSPTTEVNVITAARIRAATIVAVPAFEEARIGLVASLVDGGGSGVDGRLSSEALAALTAAAVPVEPPGAWFEDPGLGGPTAVHVTRCGRVFGHLAVWGTCHVGRPGECVEPPRSPSNYAYFRTGAVLTAEGAQVAVGHLTLGTGHAGPGESARAAAEHYDNTGTVVADVAAGEDRFGIWVAGAVRPGTTPDQIRALRAAPLSGDWRMIGGSLELVGALAVNVPGFPVPRTAGRVEADDLVALVASGVVVPDGAVAVVSRALAGRGGGGAPVGAPGGPAAASTGPAPTLTGGRGPGAAVGASGGAGGPVLTVGDLAYLKKLAQSERRADAARARKASGLADRVDRSLAEAKVRRLAAVLGRV